MSDRKANIAPSYREQKSNPSGNEGRMHQGLEHPGYYDPEKLRRKKRIQVSGRGRKDA